MDDLETAIALLDAAIAKDPSLAPIRAHLQKAFEELFDDYEVDVGLDDSN